LTAVKLLQQQQQPQAKATPPMISYPLPARVLNLNQSGTAAAPAAVQPQVVEPPPPPLKRYYGRKRANDTSSSSSSGAENSEASDNEEPQPPQLGKRADDSDDMEVETA